MSNNAASELAEKVPLIVRELLGPPPIVFDESEMLYWATIASFAATVKPSDILAWFLIKDLADARVDIHRYRQLKCQLIEQVGKPEQGPVVDLSEPMLSPEAELALYLKSEDEYSDDDRKQMARFDARRAAAAPATKGEVPLWLNSIEQIEPLLTAAEKRFIDTQQQLELHLNGLARGTWGGIEGEIFDMLPPVRSRSRGALGGALPPPRKARCRPERQRKVAK